MLVSRITIIDLGLQLHNNDQPFPGGQYIVLVRDYTMPICSLLSNDCNILTKSKVLHLIHINHRCNLNQCMVKTFFFIDREQ